MYLEREKGFVSKLMSGAFHIIWNTINNMMKKRTAEGIKTKPEHEPFLDEHEEILWQKGVLGEDSPAKIYFCFFIRVQFGLCFVA